MAGILLSMLSKCGTEKMKQVENLCSAVEQLLENTRHIERLIHGHSIAPTWALLNKVLDNEILITVTMVECGVHESIRCAFYKDHRNRLLLSCHTNTAEFSDQLDKSVKQYDKDVSNGIFRHQLVKRYDKPFNKL